MQVGIVEIFKDAAREIHTFNMYDHFRHKGWTRSLARETRQVLAPIIVKTVALAWYEALQRAQEK